MKVTESLFDTEKYLEALAHVVETEADRVMTVSSKREEQIKQFVRTAEKRVPARPSLRSESLSTDIFDDRIN